MSVLMKEVWTVSKLWLRGCGLCVCLNEGGVACGSALMKEVWHVCPP